MKAIRSAIVAAALLCRAAIVFAQDSSEPSVQSVLDAARAKYWQDKAPDGSDLPSDVAPPEASDGARARNQVPYTPIIISFVPGISFPFGYYDASIVGGAIGNLVRDVSGVAGAGVFNISRDLRGVQGAGIFNIAREVEGVQDAGVFNLVDRDVTGLQGAGVFNIVRGKVTGIQAAGLFNISGKLLAPVQAAGLFNIADEVRGFQAAGAFNIAGNVAGGQAAGVFNKADRVAGLQVGLVNVAGHIDGVQIGLVNIAGNGVGSLGLTYEPASDFAYLHWQTGTPALYTVAGIGAPSGDWLRDYTGFVASFGLGSRAHCFGLNVDLDVSAEEAIGSLPYSSIDKSDWSAWEGWSMMRPYPSARLMLGLPLARHFQVVGGVKADIDADSLGNRVPESLKRGSGWRGALFGEGFTVWPEWFFGVKI